MCNQFIERAERNESKQEAAVFSSSYCLSMCQSPLPHAFLTFQVAAHSCPVIFNDKKELGLISRMTKYLQVVKGMLNVMSDYQASLKAPLSSKWTLSLASGVCYFLLVSLYELSGFSLMFPNQNKERVPREKNKTFSLG